MGGVLDLELSHGITKSGLNLLASTTLELQAHGGVADDLLNPRDVRLELLPCLMLLGESVVSRLELFSIGNSLLNVGRRELSNRVGDGDVGSAARRLLGGGDLENTVGIDLEDDLQDSLSSLHGGDRSKGELSQRSVVLAVDTLTLENGELHSSLVVGHSGKSALLEGGHGRTTGNDRGKDVTLHGDTEGERTDIKQKKVGGLVRGSLSGQDTGLDGGTVGNSLVGVDALLELLAVEEIAQHLLDLGNTGGSSNQHNLVNLIFGNARVLENLLNGSNGILEEGCVDVLETSTGDGGVEVLTTVQRVDLDSGGGDRGEGTLGTLASRSQTTESTGVIRDVLLVFLLELGLEVLQQRSVEVLTTQVGVTSGSLDGEDTT